MKLKIARGKLEKYAREKFKIARGKSQKYAREAQQLPVANQQIKKFHGQQNASQGKKKEHWWMIAKRLENMQIPEIFYWKLPTVA